jgi:hypothetical protein
MWLRHGPHQRRWKATASVLEPRTRRTPHHESSQIFLLVIFHITLNYSSPHHLIPIPPLYNLGPRSQLRSPLSPRLRKPLIASLSNHRSFFRYYHRHPFHKSSFVMAGTRNYDFLVGSDNWRCEAGSLSQSGLPPIASSEIHWLIAYVRYQ